MRYSVSKQFCDFKSRWITFRECKKFIPSAISDKIRIFSTRDDYERGSGEEGFWREIFLFYWVEMFVLSVLCCKNRNFYRFWMENWVFEVLCWRNWIVIVFWVNIWVFEVLWHKVLNFYCFLVTNSVFEEVLCWKKLIFYCFLSEHLSFWSFMA